MLSGFPPIANSDIKILVLGSMPSVESLDKQQYYAHPRNAFWWIMGKVVGASPEIPYQQRKEILLQNHIGVWDVIKTCRRPGSLDSNIDQKTLVVNDFQQLLTNCPNVKTILLNGKSVQQLFIRHVQKKGLLKDWQGVVRVLPSTSPANARLSKEEKLEVWHPQFAV